MEFVVILRDGQRHEVEADVFEVEISDPPAKRLLRIAFGAEGAKPSRWWPGERVVLVQRRNGHLLEQVWPAE